MKIDEAIASNKDVRYQVYKQVHAAWKSQLSPSDLGKRVDEILRGAEQRYIPVRCNNGAWSDEELQILKEAFHDPCESVIEALDRAGNKLNRRRSQIQSMARAKGLNQDLLDQIIAAMRENKNGN